MITLGNRRRDNNFGFAQPQQVSMWQKLNAEQKMQIITTFYKQMVGANFTETVMYKEAETKIKEMYKGTYAPKNWLLLIGSCGLGKTLWGKSICKADDAYNKQNGYCFNQLQCSTWKIISALNLSDLIAQYESFDIICQRQKLFIDDLGTEPECQNIFGTKRNAVMEILSYRYDHNLPTILSTNLTIKPTNQIVERYGERIFDRLKEKAVLIPFVGESFRK